MSKSNMSTFQGFGAFLFKELLYVQRSLRLILVVVVFLLLGLMNAPIAKATPLILEASGLSGMAEGLGLADPTAVSAWMQFFGNVGQMGVLAILLLCGSMFSGERSKGTLVLPLTKGLGRTTVVVAKFLSVSALWLVGILVAAVSSWVCTLALFPGESVDHLFVGIAAQWLLGEFLIAPILLSSVLFKGSFAGLILPGGLLVVTGIVSGFAELVPWNPLLLGGHGLQLIMGATDLSGLVGGSIAAAVVIVVS
ncbi:MAG: hypothetical protein LBD25_05545, partial [Coriobacteriales bacterium]|nr:hypothetical protein [Coriobacteriales bacterium]